MVAAGLDGIERKLDPGEPTNLNCTSCTEQQLREKKIGLLPQNLLEAIGELEKDEVIKAGLGKELSVATAEANAEQDYKDAIIVTRATTSSTPTCSPACTATICGPSMVAAGLDPDNLPVADSRR